MIDQQRPSAAPQQLVLDLAHRTALGAEDFLVSESNSAAVAMIDNWPNWPHWALVVTGPVGSGKSHLVNVWRSRSHGNCLRASSINEGVIGQFEDTRALAVENLEGGIGDERVLFHLLNLAREQKQSILFTSRVAPGDLDVKLPDLRSRLRALPLVAIAPPDQSLLQALLVKLFNDRQLAVEPVVIAYLIRHMERSTESALRLVDEIDRQGLISHRKVTRVTAAAALARLQTSDD